MGYTKTGVIKLSVIQITFGLLLVILTGICSGICLVKKHSGYFADKIMDTGSGYWTAIPCLATGILGICSVYKGKLDIMSALYFVMNIIVAVISVISLSLECWGLKYEIEESIYGNGGGLVMYIVIIIFILVVLITSCVGSYMNCSGYGLNGPQISIVTPARTEIGVMSPQYQQSTVVSPNQGITTNVVQATSYPPQYQQQQFQPQQPQQYQPQQPQAAFMQMQVPSYPQKY